MDVNLDINKGDLRSLCQFEPSWISSSQNKIPKGQAEYHNAQPEYDIALLLVRFGIDINSFTIRQCFFAMREVPANKNSCKREIRYKENTTQSSNITENDPRRLRHFRLF